jgi:predicted nucleic acid-binding protein
LKYVLEASVAVAAVRPNEPAYAPSRARVALVLQGADEIVVPALFSIEVGAALARAGWGVADIEGYVVRLSSPPHRIVTLGPRSAGRIRQVAVACRLRAADACYVWLAGRERVPLCTLDHEVIQRSAGHCADVAPSTKSRT